MSRPVKCRRICAMPRVREFAPAGSRPSGAVEMTVDEYEAVRLIDRLGLSQAECAEQMAVSRTTVQAIYDSARSKLAEALVDCRRLVIAGGSYRLCPEAETCCGKSCRGFDRPCPAGRGPASCPCCRGGRK